MSVTRELSIEAHASAWKVQPMTIRSTLRMLPLAALLLSTPANAADPEGMKLIYGAGTMTCSQAVAETSTPGWSRSKQQYLDWVTGLVSGYVLASPGVHSLPVDIDNETLLALALENCSRHPELTLWAASGRVILALMKGRPV